VKLDLFH